jgi:hypothetical protein
MIHNIICSNSSVGPGTPTQIPSIATPNKTIPYHHWSQLYTSRLTPTLRLVGHSINTHFHTYFPHVQSFLYALSVETASLLLESGSIYDCGLTQQELGSDPAKRFELIERYEVGMSTTLLKKGYSIGTAFINRWGMGSPLVLNQNSTQGRELDDTICDIWYEDGVRNLTDTLIDKSLVWWKSSDATTTNIVRRREDTFEYHKWDILPWDHFMFFKVSRLVPRDIQDEMHYSNLDLVDVDVVPNEARESNSDFWRRKTGEFDGTLGNGIWLCGLILILCWIAYGRRKQIEMRLRVLRKQVMNSYGNGRDD